MKEIEIKVDPNTGKKKVNMHVKLAGLKEFVPNIHMEPRSYFDYEKEHGLDKYWKGYDEFEKADRPNREIIMSEAKSVIEGWFKRGVTYERTLLGDAYGTLMYTNEPEELYGLLEIAYGKIKANIMEWEKIPKYSRPQLLMWSPAIPLASYGLKGEYKAYFDWKVNGPSHGPVYWTEGKSPKERAELVSNDWYDLQSHRLYGFINELYATKGDQLKQPKSWQAVDRYLDLEQRLKRLGLSQIDRLEYYACMPNIGFQFAEVANMLRSIGVNKSAEAVRKSYHRHKELLRDQ